MSERETPTPKAGERVTVGLRTGKPIETLGQPTWTPEVIAALAQMAVSDLRERAGAQD